MSQGFGSRVFLILLPDIFLHSFRGELRTVFVKMGKISVESAADLGISCIGVSWGYGSIENMKKAGAVGIADTPEKLYDLLHC